MDPFHICFLREMKECKKLCGFFAKQEKLVILLVGNRNSTDVGNGENFILCLWGHLMWYQKHQ